MTTIANLRARFTADTSGFDRGATRVTNRMRSMIGAAAALAGPVALGAVIRRNIDAADQIGKLSQRIGASTEALSEYRHVAELSGVEFNTLTTAWQRQTRRISEAAQGTGVAVKALEELQIPIEAIKDLKPEQQFELIADRMQGVKSQADRVRLAMALWDTEGVRLVQTIGDGSKGLRQMREEARRLGKSFDQDTTDKAAAANDAITRLTASWEGLISQAAVSFAPEIERAADFARELLDHMDKVRGVVRGIGNAIGGQFATIGALATGNFSGALEIQKTLLSDTIGQIRSGFDSTARVEPNAAERESLELQRRQAQSLEVMEGTFRFGVPVVTP